MVWWDPFEEMKQMHRRMRKMFGELWPEELAGYREPLTDIWETDDSVMVKLELPGVKKEDIGLKITEDQIEVKAESKKEEKTVKEGFRKFERQYQGFYRCLGLPTDVIPEKAEASYKDGILEIKIPKTEKAKKKKEIKVEVK
jgi:HSP20 family protein